MLPRVVVLRIHAQHTLRQAQLVWRIIQPFDYHAPVMPDLVVLRIIRDHIIDVLKLLLQITAKRLEDIPPDVQIKHTITIHAIMKALSLLPILPHGVVGGIQSKGIARQLQGTSWLLRGGKNGTEVIVDIFDWNDIKYISLLTAFNSSLMNYIFRYRRSLQRDFPRHPVQSGSHQPSHCAACRESSLGPIPRLNYCHSFSMTQNHNC